MLLKFIVSHPAITCAIPATSRGEHRGEHGNALAGHPRPHWQWFGVAPGPTVLFTLGVLLVAGIAAASWTIAGRRHPDRSVKNTM